MPIQIGPQGPGLLQVMQRNQSLAEQRRQLSEAEKERKRQLYIQLAQLSMQAVDTAGKAISGGAAVGLW